MPFDGRETPNGSNKKAFAVYTEFSANLIPCSALAKHFQVNPVVNPDNPLGSILDTKNLLYI